MNPRVAQVSDPAYLKAAFSMLGLSEIEGARHEKRVLAMYKASGHPEVHEDEVPWCAAFVGDCLRQAGLPNTGSLLAKSYVNYGTPTSFSGFSTPRGAICVWTRNGGGHVNFCLEDDGSTLTCIGGNQENGKGGGVTISRRRKDSGLIAAVLPSAKRVVAPAPKPLPPPDIEPTPAPEDTKPAIESKTIWAQIGTVLASVGGLLTDWRVAAVIVVAALACFVIWDRAGKPDIRGWLSK